VVNLLVTPEQAEVLSLASNETRIQLILRNPLDTETAKVPGSAMNALFHEQKPPAPAAPRVKKTVLVAAKPVQSPAAAPAPPQILVVEVLNGPRRAEAKFQVLSEEKQ